MARLTPPESGIVVRMYRQGHGDCFLMATRKISGVPCYVLIDCGRKSKSEIKSDVTMSRVIEDIADATGGCIDVVVITHEHEDHVNGFLTKRTDGKKQALLWDKIIVREVWLAWTEDDDDAFANTLRARFDDQLIGLIGVARRLTSRTSDLTTASLHLANMIAFESGDDDPSSTIETRANEIRKAESTLSDSESLRLALGGRANKEAMRYMREKAQKAPFFLRPDRGPYDLPDVRGLRVFALGPPRDEKLLLSLDPEGKEEFHLGLRLDGATRAFLGAVENSEIEGFNCPFGPRHGLALEGKDKLELRQNDLQDPDKAEAAAFFAKHYRHDDNDWRNIDRSWLDPAEALALRLNSEVNNTSLVLAFELPNTGKVLLFTGDAQRGSWISWSNLSWQLADGKTVRSRDLLARCVLYKVGHHGSHNATLNGSADDDYANLGWMAQGKFRDEFVAMIPANAPWAAKVKPYPWLHPLRGIETALRRMARGRVLQSDKGEPQKPVLGYGESWSCDVSDAEWTTFQERIVVTDCYFDCVVEDK